jgi:hypothetical protein
MNEVAESHVSTGVRRARVQKYITAKVVNQKELATGEIKKVKLAVDAGYSLATAEHNVLEKTGLYTEEAHEFIGKTGFILNDFLNSAVEAVKRGDTKDLPLDKLIRATATMATIYKGLLPTYKRKEVTKNNDGSYTSVWTTLNQ